MASKRVVRIAEPAIHLIRGQRVMLDSDLAAIYQVSTKRLNEQLRRNRSRFPSDFAFQTEPEEFTHFRSQFATSSLRSHFAISQGRGGRPIANLFQVIRQLLAPAEKPKREIGFHVRENGARYRIRKTVRI